MGPCRMVSQYKFDLPLAATIRLKFHLVCPSPWRLWSGTFWGGITCRFGEKKGGSKRQCFSPLSLAPALLLALGVVGRERRASEGHCTEGEEPEMGSGVFDETELFCEKRLLLGGNVHSPPHLRKPHIFHFCNASMVPYGSCSSV